VNRAEVERLRQHCSKACVHDCSCGQQTQDCRSSPHTLEVAEAQALARIASLAASILVCLRRPGRGRYDSERQLRQWLSSDNVSYTTSDLAHALTLLEATKRIGRDPELAWPLPAETQACSNQIWTSAMTIYSSVPMQIAEQSTHPIEVQTATWSPGGQLDWWMKERQEWFGRVRGANGRQRWIKAVDLRPVNGSPP
jgi:hypothetical protein